MLKLLLCFLCGAVCGRGEPASIWSVCHSVNYSPLPALLLQHKTFIVFYLRIDRVCRTVRLVLRLYLSSNCCSSSIKATEVCFFILLNKYLYCISIVMKFWCLFRCGSLWETTPPGSYYRCWITPQKCWIEGTAVFQQRGRGMNPCDARFCVHARTQAGSRWEEAVRLEDALSPLVAHHHFTPNIPLKHPVPFFSCFLYLPSLPFLEI